MNKISFSSILDPSAYCLVASPTWKSLFDENHDKLLKQKNPSQERRENDIINFGWRSNRGDMSCLSYMKIVNDFSETRAKATELIQRSFCKNTRGWSDLKLLQVLITRYEITIRVELKAIERKPIFCN